MASPKREANNVSKILNLALGEERFPVDVKEVALQYSRDRFPDDYIHTIGGRSLDDFEGALIPSPKHKSRWYIAYNEDIKSVGRQRFTLAHEFGHYLLHRHLIN